MNGASHPTVPSVQPCRICGQEHRLVPLAPGERALCRRCGAVLAKRSRWGPDTALAFAATGLILAFPAALLPFVIAGKLGHNEPYFLFTGVAGLWHQGMGLIAVLVCLCGGLLPAALLVTMAEVLGRARFGLSTLSPRFTAAAVPILARWAMPEVQVLAVLVAIVKLGTLITIRTGPGFWCYFAMSVALLIAFRSFDLESKPAPAP